MAEESKSKKEKEIGDGTKKEEAKISEKKKEKQKSKENEKKPEEMKGKKSKEVKIGDKKPKVPKKEEEEKSVKLAPPFEVTPSKLVINPRGSLEVHIKNVSAMRQEMLIRLQSVRLRLQSAQICENLSLVHRVAAPGATVSVRIRDSGVFCGFELEEHAYSKPKLPEGFFHVEARSAEPKVKQRDPKTYVMVCDKEAFGKGCNEHVDFITGPEAKVNGIGLFFSDLSTTVIMEPDTKSYKEQREKIENAPLDRSEPELEPVPVPVNNDEMNPKTDETTTTEDIPSHWSEEEFGVKNEVEWPSRLEMKPARTEESLRKRVIKHRKALDKWADAEEEKYNKIREAGEKKRKKEERKRQKKLEQEEKKRKEKEQEPTPVAPVQIQQVVTPPRNAAKPKKKKKKQCTIS